MELMAKWLGGRGKGRLPSGGGEGNNCVFWRTEGMVTCQVAGASSEGSTEKKAAGCGWVGVGQADFRCPDVRGGLTPTVGVKGVLLAKVGTIRSVWGASAVHVGSGEKGERCTEGQAAGVESIGGGGSREKGSLV